MIKLEVQGTCLDYNRIKNSNGVNESCRKGYQITLRKLNELTCNEWIELVYVYLCVYVIECLQTG